MFDRSQTKKFKDDGVNWMKKKGQNRVSISSSRSVLLQPFNRLRSCFE